VFEARSVSSVASVPSVGYHGPANAAGARKSESEIGNRQLSISQSPIANQPIDNLQSSIDNDQPRHPIPLDRLAAQKDSAAYETIDWTAPIDRSRWFVCETQTPLYYTRSYGELTAGQRLRYNQLTGMLSNELIALLETELLTAALRAIESSHTPDPDLVAAVRRFRHDEKRHAEMWRRLNRLSEPAWYAAGDRYLARIPSPAIALARALARRPAVFPVVLWIQLAQEERSIDMSRRSLALPPNHLEPRYRAAHQAHVQDEVRHVQLDWHLIGRFYNRRSKAIRLTTARLFRFFVGSVLLMPVYSTTRVIRALAGELPELQPHVPRMLNELRGLQGDDRYHEMMYSRRTTPITFALLDRFEEFRGVGKSLRGYQPK
jgi:P-aminobenzoate N-oxygenase AurF